ncbi:MAG: Asp-tRNA(Asn)/Glu-tRNA(Gln) amidotransferase subunit GatB [Anaerolineae bacterium]|nr:Asp-tRNA(Asn)/Glu-tRNA(Gln) amidotransferase subunit GatB [Anaerolineae bacterium]NIN93873.1 Asp-tRNA(Asn)/Glu-tRNA(Gln) amidotransferase subunit GatB [Anaerolineae bacterium]NIQ76906.1 Asp-tRNA(Asn)/Glu-tRNA(Gln) amidotransferase subunit GatB [Anaerolineae bacterium]
MEYEAIIGMEVHAQLSTKSKMFCGCRAEIVDRAPNSLVCPVCLGMPGVLPTINRKAIEYSFMTALALECEVREGRLWFDRKNYFYPDLPKSYQISMHSSVVGRDGHLLIELNGTRKEIGIADVHVEEDTARLYHRDDGGDRYTLVDFNRSGVPLIEIVSRPDMRSPEEAKRYLQELRKLLRYLDVSTGDMEAGSFRCEANISLRPKGIETLGNRVEIKNMNTFQAVEHALKSEIERQAAILEAGDKVVQQTVGWREELGRTEPQRVKEEAHDYRYFPEPDLPPFVVTRGWLEELHSRLPELPGARRDRFMSEYELPFYDAYLLTEDPALADYFEECARLYPRAKALSNWMTGELFRLLNVSGEEIGAVKVKPGQLAELLTMIDEGRINISTAKTVFEEMFGTGRSAKEIIAESDLVQISDAEELSDIVAQVLSENPEAIADYLAGKTQVLRFLVGQVMKATRGKANPQMVQGLLKDRLKATEGE